MSENLLAFLNARLDEDEAVADAAKQESTGRWTARETTWGGGTVVEDGSESLILPTRPTDSAMHYHHIARHDPAHVLAEVAAKRRLIDIVECLEMSIDNERGCGPATPPEEMDGLRALALPYADHPDYREEWRLPPPL